MKLFIITTAIISISTITFSQEKANLKRKDLTKTAIPIKKKAKAKNLETFKITTPPKKSANVQSKPILYTEPKKK